MSRPAMYVATVAQPAGSIYEAEYALLGSCMMNAAHIDAASAHLAPDDFETDIIGRCFAVLIGLRSEGRRPSFHSLLAELNDTDGTAKPFLVQLVADAAKARATPIMDTIEVIKDRVVRRQLAEAAKHLEVAVTTGTRSTADAAAETLDTIDLALSRIRPTQRRSYDANSAGDEVFSFLDNGEKIPTSGWEQLNQVIGGLPKGEFTVFAGRPGMAKTAAGACSARLAAEAGHGVQIFSVEMRARLIQMRILADAAYRYDDPIFYKDIIGRKLSGSHRARLEEAHARCRELPLFIEEQSDITVAEIAARCRKRAADLEKQGKSLDIVYVDHIGLLKPSARYAGSRTHEIADISNGLRVLAKDLNVAVVGLCQLNRGVEGRESKRPTKADLRDSGEIEEDASNVILLYRPYYYLAQQKFDDPEEIQLHAAALEKARYKLEFIVDKNRNGEAPITVELFVDIGANAIRRKSFGEGLKPRSGA